MCKRTLTDGPRGSGDASEVDSRRREGAPEFLKMSELMAAVKAGDLASVLRLFASLSEEEARAAAMYRAPDTRETLLFGACSKGQTEVARFLLSVPGRGQSDAGTAWGAAPLHAASERSHEAIVRLLLENGADLNAQTSYGDTPLHLAAYRGNDAIVRCLVEAGCRLDAVNCKGRTALDDASAARHGRIVQYLREVTNLGNQGFAENHRRNADNDKMDLMRTRPLRPPTASHQKLDRSISWHSCPGNLLRGNGDSQSDLEGGATASRALSSESPGRVNDLSLTPAVATAGSPRRDAPCMNVIAEVTVGGDAAAGNQRAASPNRAPAARTRAENARRDYRHRSASDSRVEELERMVERLQRGLASTQEELGRTRQELGRARNSMSLSPCRTTAKGGCGCCVRCPKGTVRLVLNVRD